MEGRKGFLSRQEGERRLRGGRKKENSTLSKKETLLGGGREVKTIAARRKRNRGVEGPDSPHGPPSPAAQKKNRPQQGSWLSIVKATGQGRREDLSNSYNWGVVGTVEKKGKLSERKKERGEAQPPVAFAQ